MVSGQEKEEVAAKLRPIIPYPTGRFFRVTLSQALRARLRSVLSLRDALADISQQHLAKACCEMSRRDGAIEAWHEVPGTAPPQKSRPVGYGLIRAGVRTDSMIGVTVFRARTSSDTNLSRRVFSLPKKHGAQFDELAAPDHTVPYGTVPSRDAFPGTSCQATIGVVPTGRAGRHFATASS